MVLQIYYVTTKSFTIIQNFLNLPGRGKKCYICFHRVKECATNAIPVLHKVMRVFNLSDILTKYLPAFKRISLRNNNFDG